MIEDLKINSKLNSKESDKIIFSPNKYLQE